MNKTIMIMILGAVVIGMAVSASAEEEILPRPVSEEIPVDSDDLIIAPNPDAEPLIIAPNPDATISHDADEGERGLEETVIAPNSDDTIDIMEDGESSEIIDTAGTYAAVAKDSQTSSVTIGAQGAVIIGAVFVLLAALVIYKRKK